MRDGLRFWILHYGIWTPGTGSRIPLVKLGFRFPIISGISDSLSWISESRYLFPGDKMKTDLHLLNGGVPLSCFQCLISGAPVRDPVVSVDAALT